jgi:putative acetyltransferase
MQPEGKKRKMSDKTRNSQIIIRPEKPPDIPGISEVNRQAFGTTVEANLVDALRSRGAVTFSLVAVRGEKIIGHILLSPVEIVSQGGSSTALGLGPIAVLPEEQRKGIGGRLIAAGLEECRQAGHEVVVVLGEPEYYSRFGFKTSKPYGIRYEQEIPEQFFMVLELRPGALAGRTGIVKYQSEFSGV